MLLFEFLLLSFLWGLDLSRISPILEHGIKVKDNNEKTPNRNADLINKFFEFFIFGKAKNTSSDPEH